MKILIVKLSSLGDVVHTMPAMQDLHAVFPEAQIDWVVERPFAPLVRRCRGVTRVIECELRRWRKSLFASGTRAEWRAFKAGLREVRYDAVIDLQGLTKSALVSWLAALAPGGKRYAMANRSQSSGYEAPTRWVADVAVRVDPHGHMVRRARELCAAALGYTVPATQSFGLEVIDPLSRSRERAGVRAAALQIAFIHGTSRADKCWPLPSWVDLGRRLHATGFAIALPHGTHDEQLRSEQIARELAAMGVQATVWPRLALDALADELAACAGAIGVDSGLSHIAVALGLPHVQIYNFDTAWRSGPQGVAWQRSVYAKPAPGVDAVWRAWLDVAPASTAP